MPVAIQGICIGCGVVACQDVNDKYSLTYPKLYSPGQRDLFFNKRVFAWSVAEGLASSLVLFFIPYGALSHTVNPAGRDIADQKAFGFVVASSLIVTVTLRVPRLQTSLLFLI